MRLYGDTTDGDENFNVEETETAPFEYIVQAFGLSQTFPVGPGITSIYANGGKGNNVITMRNAGQGNAVNTVPVHLIGGEGTNTVQAGTEGSVLEGNPGDTLLGGAGNDVIIVSVPNGFTGPITGTFNGGGGIDSLFVRPASGNAYMRITQTGTFGAANAVFAFTNYTASDMKTVSSSFAIPYSTIVSTAYLGMAAAEGASTENYLTIDSSVMGSSILLIGSPNSKADFLNDNSSGNQILVGLAAFTTFVGGTGTDMFHVLSNPADYSITNPSIYVLTLSSDSYPLTPPFTFPF